MAQIILLMANIDLDLEIYGGNYFLYGGEKTAIGYVRAALILRVKEQWRDESGSRPTPLPRGVQRLARDLELVCRGYPVFDPVAQLSFKQQLNGSQSRPVPARSL